MPVEWHSDADGHSTDEYPCVTTIAIILEDFDRDTLPAAADRGGPADRRLDRPVMV